MKKHPIVGILVYLWCLVADAQWRGNILYLVGVPSPSHHIWNRAIMLELAQRGYNLTVLTVELEESLPNLHFITMEDVYEVVQREWNAGSIGVDTAKRSSWSIVSDSYNFYHFVSQKLASTEGFRRLMDYPDDFNVSAVIHDFSLGQMMLGFVEKFGNPPLISVSPFGVPPHTWSVAGEPHLAPFSPHFATGYPTEMHFGQKILNLAMHFWDWMYRELIFMRRETALAMEFFPEVNLYAIERRSSVILVNREPLLDGGGSLPTNVINVGALHADREGWLSPEVEQTLSSSKPVILFSVGSNMRSDLLDEQIIAKFVSVFQKLNQFSVIWKYEGKRPFNWPKNILTVDWIDQNKLLEHPNLVLFITHGGLLSVQEAAWNGVPILGMPLFMDQHSNVAKAVSRDIALDIDVNSFTAEELESKILQLIEGGNFRANAGKISKMLQRQESPLSRAVSWIENIAENGELPQLKCHVNLHDILIPIIFILFCANLLWDAFLNVVSRITQKRTTESDSKRQKLKVQ
ncbi:UDP-glycosyltransferase UGT5-like [Phlebotomus argentipes]|uniref:UDP-glycosyltransferase UGT5-like n=1 Tax=Phlebotomus argentipes TaxID=94469 RepID=UPI002893763B|nr:UDP-glycosyltransferase UGT5-like [Phlebotomus argentipes]